MPQELMRLKINLCLVNCTERIEQSIQYLSIMNQQIVYCALNLPYIHSLNETESAYLN